MRSLSTLIPPFLFCGFFNLFLVGENRLRGKNEEQLQDASQLLACAVRRSLPRKAICTINIHRLITKNDVATLFKAKIYYRVSFHEHTVCEHSSDAWRKWAVCP